MFENPIFFERNRVFRVYNGGKLFADFFGDDSEDGFFPEEWVASSVTALNKESRIPKEGVSKTEGEGLYFDDLLKSYPNELLGDNHEFAILVKFLDSAIRLPIQAHPDKAFSLKYFNSTHGKTESWLILATRPNAKIYFGFRDGVTKEEFVNAIEQSKTDKFVMQGLMNEYDAKPGDVYLVPPKTVHAIGAGCLILETQEATDFTIQPEYLCGDYRLSEQEMYLGLDFETAMECFEFNTKTNAKKEPVCLTKEDGLCYEELIGPKDTDCFRVNRLTLENNSYRLSDKAAIYIVTDGKGTICADNNSYRREISRGDYFFLPYNAADCTVSGTITLAICTR